MASLQESFRPSRSPHYTIFKYKPADCTQMPLALSAKAFCGSAYFVLSESDNNFKEVNLSVLIEID